MHEAPQRKARPALLRAHDRLHKGIWLATALAIALGMLTAYIASHTATEHTFLAETVGEWRAMDYIERDRGAELYVVPVSRPAPILRDMVDGQSYLAACRHAGTECNTLLRNHGTLVDRHPDTRPETIVVRQARVTLHSTIFGKHTLEGVTYIELPALPDAIRRHTLEQLATQLVCTGNGYLQVKLVNAYPQARAALERASRLPPNSSVCTRASELIAAPATS